MRRIYTGTHHDYAQQVWSPVTLSKVIATVADEYYARKLE